VDKKFKGPFASRALVLLRLSPLATARWMQLEKTERGALGWDGIYSEVCNP
jgi:hypothetical protein